MRLVLRKGITVNGEKITIVFMGGVPTGRGLFCKDGRCSSVFLRATGCFDWTLPEEQNEKPQATAVTLAAT